MILLVDDEKNFREMLSIELTSRGYDIIQAENGMEAISKLETCDPCLVILDFKMPVMDGLQTLNAIKAIEKFSNLKVLFLSNYGESTEKFITADENVAKECGAAGFAAKSEDIAELVKKIEKAIKI